MREKTPGEDGISAVFWKALPEEGFKELHQLINLVRKNEVIPEGWSIARIYPIYKVGDEDQAANYKGISLLDTVYKLLTKMMAARLKN